MERAEYQLFVVSERTNTWPVPPSHDGRAIIILLPDR